jgi:hypothetical protein
MIEAKMLSQIKIPSDDAFRSYAGACSNCRFILPPLSQVAPIFFEKGSECCAPIHVRRA